MTTVLPMATPGLRVLAIGAHPDDIELGAGGLVHRLTSAGATVEFLILSPGVKSLVTSTRGPYEPAERVREATEAAAVLGVPEDRIHVGGLADCTLHNHGHDMVAILERQIFDDRRIARFDVILSHAGADTHADHRSLHESTIAAVRDFHGTVLLYQTPSTLPNGFHPTFFVNLTAGHLDVKQRALSKHISQRERDSMMATRTSATAAYWSVFLRLAHDQYLEAFEVYRAYF